MAQQPIVRPSLAELEARLDALGPLEKGEIIDGELYVQPRPRFRHGRVNAFLGRHVGGSFDFDPEGPGGWWIAVEPGIDLPGAPEVSPDLAGWRRQRMPEPPADDPLTLVPDWVCEVLSPSNARDEISLMDRGRILHQGLSRSSWILRSIFRSGIQGGDDPEQVTQNR